MGDLVALKLQEADFVALKTRAADITTSTGFRASDVAALDLCMEAWQRLGATRDLFDKISLRAEEAIRGWQHLYPDRRSCEDSFNRIFPSNEIIGAAASGDTAQPLDMPLSAVSTLVAKPALPKMLVTTT